MKSERNAAILLLSAAVLGLMLANSPVGVALNSFKHLEVGLAALNLEMSLSHWVSDLLLAGFFLIAALELKFELKLGVLSKFRTALVPVTAATGGIVLPALIYVAFNWNSQYLVGWPIPTATDIAFALGLLAIFGRGLPREARIFLLALAIFDDLVAILLIAIFYTAQLKVEWLMAAALIAATHALLERQRKIPLLLVRIASFSLLWYCIYQSGVHATIAGVILGLLVPAKNAHQLAERLHPWSNTVVLPLFAFFAVSIELPQFNGAISAAFWGIVVALPLGKAIGITVGAIVAQRFASTKARLNLEWRDFLAVALLAGVGFTVSMLMTKLAFENNPEILAEATMAVVIGSLISMMLGGWLATNRAKHYRAQK